MTIFSPPSPVFQETSVLTVTELDADDFLDACRNKATRRHLQILVVEDQVFSQKLLAEILSSARVSGSNSIPVIDTAYGIHDAWAAYLRKAPDLVFIDLKLSDGSGHVLAQAIKELDPESHIVIVTASNDDETIRLTRQIDVDGFIIKPYRKKQILDCVERYAAARGIRPDGAMQAIQSG